MFLLIFLCVCCNHWTECTWNPQGLESIFISAPALAFVLVDRFLFSVALAFWFLELTLFSIIFNSCFFLTLIPDPSIPCLWGIYLIFTWTFQHTICFLFPFKFAYLHIFSTFVLVIYFNVWFYFLRFFKCNFKCNDILFLFDWIISHYFSVQSFKFFPRQVY